VPASVAEYSVCERTCRDTRDRCTDNSAKERETGTTCDQDLKGCLDLCSAQAQSDPSGREQITKPRGEDTVSGTHEPAGRIIPRGH
jgi:hypothetical protein